MRCPKILVTLVLAGASLAAMMTPARAAINSMSLGATFTASNTEIRFRVYSSQASYMMLYLYSAGYGVQESATYVLSQAGNGVWAVTVPVSAIQAAGITGTVYYGYRDRKSVV